jgi:hypothetical protein
MGRGERPEWRSGLCLQTLPRAQIHPAVMFVTKAGLQTGPISRRSGPGPGGSS